MTIKERAMSYESKRDAAWQDAAYFATRRLLRKTEGAWMAEEILPNVIAKIGEPNDRRSFGAVVRRLRLDGHVQPAGVGRARTSHSSLKTRWERVA